METLIRFFCSKIIQVNFRNVLLMPYFYFKRVKNKWKIKKWINEKIISSTSFRWMFFRWRNVLQAHWIRLAACCSKRKHISIEIHNRVQKVTIISIFFHYITSLRIMFLSRDINFRHVRCITHAALCWGRKHTLTLKKNCTMYMESSYPIFVKWWKGKQ